VTAERAEAAQPARKHDDLLILAGPAKCVEHPLNAIVVAIDQCIIEDDGSGFAPLGKHRAQYPFSWHGGALENAVQMANHASTPWAHSGLGAVFANRSRCADGALRPAGSEP
jgi:hypothetical protein